MSVNVSFTRDTFQVRESCDIELIARSAEALGPGDTVEFQFPHSWSLVSGPSFTRPFQANDPDAPHYVTVESEGASFDVQIVPHHLWTDSERGGRHGRRIVGTLRTGRVPAGEPIRIRYANTFAPYVSETEEIWVRVKGEMPASLPPLVTTPGPGVALRIIAPSGVEPGQAFDVLIVSLDAYENASSTAYENKALLDQDGQVVASGLSFVGSVRVPVSLSEEGVHRFRMDETVSNAVRVRQGERGPYWGDIHIHSKLSSDAQGTDPYDYARDVSGLDFGGLADHAGSLGRAGFDQALAWAREAYAPGRFVSVLGLETQPSSFGWSGHINAYFRDEKLFVAYGEDPDQTWTVEPLKALGGREKVAPRDLIMFPHHTGIAFGPIREGSVGSSVDLDRYPYPDYAPVMEIYSHHGQSDIYAPQHALAYEFNRMRNPERRANSSVPGPRYAQDYWRKGYRLGVIGSSDEHSGQGGRRHGGIAAVFAHELTRAGIHDGLLARRCYATTGERILLDFRVDGIPMGQEGVRKPGSKLEIALNVWATDLLLRVEILRYRPGVDRGFMTILSEAPRPESMDAAYALEDDFDGPAIYYARITQEPLAWPGMAWSSPVWVDVQE